MHTLIYTHSAETAHAETACDSWRKPHSATQIKSENHKSVQRWFGATQRKQNKLADIVFVTTCFTFGVISSYAGQKCRNVGPWRPSASDNVHNVLCVWVMRVCCRRFVDARFKPYYRFQSRSWRAMFKFMLGLKNARSDFVFGHRSDRVWMFGCELGFYICLLVAEWRFIDLHIQSNVIYI